MNSQPSRHKMRTSGADPQGVGSAYVHIPFCVRKCTYCDFCSYPNQSVSQQRAYVAALRREISAVAAWASEQSGRRVPQLDTVFIGGGTPTVLEPANLNAILNQLRQDFGLTADCETTLEANPGTVTQQGLFDLRAAGFNRISFGLQAIQPHLLQLLGRIHNQADFIRGVRWAEQAGFTSINADIMLGLPGQSLSDVKATVDAVLALPIDHVSFYALILEDKTPLKALCDSKPDLLPDDDQEREHYHEVRQRLAASGLIHYEISNAARPGRQCRHNLTYWQARPYYGFGVAAHSYLDGVRRGNTTKLADYLAAFGPAVRQLNPFAAAQVLEKVDTAGEQKEMLLLGLRLLAGVCDSDFQSRFGVSLYTVFAQEIAELQKRNLLLVDGQCVRLSDLGLDMANQVFMAFV